MFARLCRVPGSQRAGVPRQAPEAPAHPQQGDGCGTSSADGQWRNRGTRKLTQKNSAGAVQAVVVCMFIIAARVLACQCVSRLKWGTYACYAGCDIHTAQPTSNAVASSCGRTPWLERRSLLHSHLQAT